MGDVSYNRIGTDGFEVKSETERFTSTVEPRLSGLVGTSVKSPDNRKYEY